MSSIRTIKMFKKLTVELSDISRDALTEAEKKLTDCFMGRFEKLKTYLKDMTVYKDKKWIMVNDGYHVHPEFEEVAKAFGFLTGRVDCTIKGDNFVVTDRIFGFLSVLNCDKDMFDGVEGETPDKKLKDAVNKTLNEMLEQQDLIERKKELSNAIDEIREKGSYTVKGIEELEKKVMDRRTLHEKSLGVRTDGAIKYAWEKLTGQIKNYVDNFSQWMKEGVKMMISSRAKSLGYSVQEQVQDGKIKLVLIRN